MQNLKYTNARMFRESVWPFFGAFVLWCIAFRGFLLDRYPLIEDALSYILNSKYLIDSISHGYIPFWTREFFGIPYDFFLLRLGNYNPLYLVMTALCFLKLPYLFSYLWTLAVYYFLGCFGFFLLAKRLTGHWLASFLGFLLLYFSSLGTRMFDSFILLVFVPLAWFFYFVVAFFQTPSRKNFLGAVFTAMILLSTYVPFYFLIAAGLSAVLMGLIFPRAAAGCFKTAGAFVRREKILTAVGLCAVLIALLPGLFFFQSSQQGSFVMSHRGRNVASDNALEVDFKTVDEWAILEDIAYSVDFSDFRRMKLAVLYIPVMVWILFLMGLGARFNRRQLFFILMGGILLVIGIPQDFPLHKFLFDHFYIFRLFRNLHFFLWWAVLPCFILLVVDQLAVLSRQMEKGRFSAAWICYLTMVHLLVLIGVVHWYQPVVYTALTIGLSYVFFLMYFSGRLRIYSLTVIGLCALVMVGIHPLEVYHYLSVNSKPREFIYGHENSLLQPPYLNFWHPRFDPESHYQFYIAMRDMQTFSDRVPIGLLQDYMRTWFIVYDAVSPCPETEHDWAAFVRSLKAGRDRACVVDWDPDNLLTYKKGTALRIFGPGQGVDILAFEPNSMTIETVFDQPKLLVWNDAYHSGWDAFLDGTGIPIYRANVAFKGVYVPAGRHVIRFQYKTVWYYLLRIFIWMVYLAVFIGLMVAILKKKERA